tara:strand:- start:459 stop:884 length:426 start_codon:yes stop_codon:yes gene_type:complete
MKKIIFLFSLIYSLLGFSSGASQKNLNSKERKQLAEAIKVEAYKFADNPSDYGLVLPVEKLVWKMIEGSEGISSCSIPSYDLTRSMEILNATFLKMSAQMKQYQGMPGKYKEQAMAQAESEINGQKAVLGKVLNNVIRYCI